MADEIYQDHECTCLARFRSDDELVVHLEEYRSRERYYSAEIQKCRTHTRPDDDDDRGAEGIYNEDGTASTAQPSAGAHVRKPRLCPHPTCQGQPEYKSRLSLRRHFLQHIECVEGCVACHEVFRLASQFIRHIDQRTDEQHTSASKRKVAYIRDTCQELRNRADEELDAWEKGNKRPMANIGTRPARRAKLDYPDHAASSLPNLDVVVYSTPLDTPAMPIPDVPTNAAASQASYSHMDGTAAILVDNIEIAPILRTLSFPQWDTTELGIGDEILAYRDQ